MSGWIGGVRVDTEADPKACTACGNTKPLDDYPARRDTRRGTTRHLAHCRDCESVRLRAATKKARARAVASAQSLFEVRRAHEGWRKAAAKGFREHLRRVERALRPTPEPSPPREPMSQEEIRERWRLYQRRRRKEQPRLTAARRAVQHAVELGELWKPPVCQRCGEERPPKELHGHHHNGYDMAHWVDVQWLCVPCHAGLDDAYGGKVSVRTRRSSILAALGAPDVVSQAAIAQECGVSPSTIARDIQALRAEGHKIESLWGRRGGVRLVS